MRVVLTTVPGLSHPGVEFRGIRGLGIEQTIRARQAELVRAATLPESTASRMMAKLAEPPLRQAYFRIRGRSYYLDFFFKGRMLAVEIDGSSHKARREADRRRDADFRSVGIRTVRIKNRDVMSGRLFEKLFARIYNVRHRK